MRRPPSPIGFLPPAPKKDRNYRSSDQGKGEKCFALKEPGTLPSQGQREDSGSQEERREGIVPVSPGLALDGAFLLE